MYNYRLLLLLAVLYGCLLAQDLGSNEPIILSGQQGLSFTVDEGEITAEGVVEMLLSLETSRMDALWFAHGKEFQSDTFNQIVLRPSAELLAVPAGPTAWKTLNLGSIHDTGAMYHHVLLNSFGSSHKVSLRIRTDCDRLTDVLSTVNDVHTAEQEIEARIGVICWSFDPAVRGFVAQATLLSEPIWLKRTAGKARLIGYSNFGVRLSIAASGRFGPFH